MASFNKFQIFVQNLANGVHNLGSDSLKIALTNTAPTATNTIFSNITEIAAGNGYTAGGATVTVTTSTETSGTYSLIGSAANPTWTASGSVGPFRYVVLYDSTPTTPLKPLIGYWDYGSNLTLSTGNTFTVAFDAVNGIIQIS